MKTIAVIPAYYEEGKIGTTVKKTKPFVNKIVVINDGSTDNTSKEAEENGAFIIEHEKNMGAGAAIRTGIDYAIKNKYDVCIILGGDDQDDPNQIQRILEKIKQGYDFVQGSRYISEGGKTINIPLFREITTKVYSFLFSFLIGKKITDGTNGFRAFKTNIFQNKNINIWQKWLNRYELEPYLYYQLIKNNFKITEVPVTKKYHEDKNKSYTKMIPVIDYWRILKPLFFLRFRIKK